MICRPNDATVQQQQHVAWAQLAVVLPNIPVAGCYRAIVDESNKYTCVSIKK
jgi:hypothetical protein